MKTLSERFPERFFEFRKKKGITVNELARRIGCSVSYVYYIQQGRRKVTLQMLEKISEILGVPIIELLGLNEGE